MKKLYSFILGLILGMVIILVIWDNTECPVCVQSEESLNKLNTRLDEALLADKDGTTIIGVEK